MTVRMVRAALCQGRSLGYCSSERFVAQSPCQLVVPWYLYVSPGMDELIVSAIWIGRVDVFDPRRSMPPGPLGDQQYGAPARAFGGSGLPLYGPSVEKDGQVAVDVLNAGMMAMHVQVSLFGTVPEEEAPSVSAPATVSALDAELFAAIEADGLNTFGLDEMAARFPSLERLSKAVRARRFAGRKGSGA